jgi:hypothetical protein
VVCSIIGHKTVQVIASTIHTVCNVNATCHLRKHTASCSCEEDYHVQCIPHLVPLRASSPHGEHDVVRCDCSILQWTEGAVVFVWTLFCL